MLEALVHRQDDHAAGAAEAPLHQEARQVRLRPRAVAFVPGEDLADLRGELHDGYLPFFSCFGLPAFG